MRSTPSADRFVSRVAYHLLSELARRLVAQRLVLVDCIVMLEPDVKLAQHGYGIRARTNPGVIALDERAHCCLGQAVLTDAPLQISRGLLRDCFSGQVPLSPPRRR